MFNPVELGSMLNSKASRPLKTKDDLIEIALGEREARAEAEREKRRQEETEAQLLLEQRKKNAIKKKMTRRKLPPLYPLLSAMQRKRQKGVDNTKASRGGLSNVLAAIAKRKSY